MNRIILSVTISVLLMSSCNTTGSKCANDKIISNDVALATQQIGRQVAIIENSATSLNPRTVKNNKIEYIPIDDWTSGFFPGTIWYMFELTGDNKWEKYAKKYTENLDSVKYITWHHDVGFIINSSYGNAYRITKNPLYKAVIIETAKSLATRYRPISGVIQSWDENRGWQGTQGWMCPVIIDNMMNLELLFKASDMSGDSTFRKMAISHANVTMANHFRKDYSCYHVVDYDKIKGGVRSKCTAQGYSNESAWARGQAWALYGFTVCYRETKDKKYLDLVDKIYNFIFTNKNMPADLIPYWDFNAPNIPNEPRDASAAAIMASALYELNSLGRPEYKKTADKIIESLSSPAYLAILGTNSNFLLMHSVGSIPHQSEIDVPLNYADYYFLEALTRKKALENK
jgi:rhamnogalacturonyl hydrolase YesR